MTIADALEMSPTHTAQLILRQTRWLVAQAPGGGYLVVRFDLGHVEGWKVKSLSEMAQILTRWYPLPSWRWNEIQERWKPIDERVEQAVGQVDFHTATRLERLHTQQCRVRRKPSDLRPEAFVLKPAGTAGAMVCAGLQRPS